MRSPAERRGETKAETIKEQQLKLPILRNRSNCQRDIRAKNIVIMEKDLLTMPKEEIMKNRVDLTITGGKIVYKR